MSSAITSLYLLNLLRLVSKLVGWCFEPSQPQRNISRLREAFIKRYVVERTNKAKIKPEEQNEKKNGELSGEFTE